MKKVSKGLESNIWKFAIYAVTNKRTYMTFLSVYMLTFPDATVKTIGVITFVAQIFAMALELPSGYISDSIGHKNALIVSKASLLTSTLCYVFATSVPWFYHGVFSGRSLVL